MKRYSKKGLEKRKAERECLSDFFIRHVNKIKTEKLHCANCEEQLKGDVSEVAHRLPKSTFKSIQCDDDNVVYLGGRFLDINVTNKLHCPILPHSQHCLIQLVRISPGRFFVQGMQ